MAEVMKTRLVSGASKFILRALLYLALAMAWLAKYAPAEATTMMMRITKIQTSSWA